MGDRLATTIIDMGRKEREWPGPRSINLRTNQMNQSESTEFTDVHASKDDTGMSEHNLSPYNAYYHN